MTDGDDGAVMGEACTDRNAALPGALFGLGMACCMKWVSVFCIYGDFRRRQVGGAMPSWSRDVIAFAE